MKKVIEIKSLLYSLPMAGLILAIFILGRYININYQHQFDEELIISIVTFVSLISSVFIFILLGFHLNKKAKATINYLAYLINGAVISLISSTILFATFAIYG